MMIFDWGFEDAASSRLWRWNLIKICLRTCDVIKKSYFGKQNSTLGSVVPLAMFSLFNTVPKSHPLMFWPPTINNSVVRWTGLPWEILVIFLWEIFSPPTNLQDFLKTRMNQDNSSNVSCAISMPQNSER